MKTRPIDMGRMPETDRQTWPWFQVLMRSMRFCTTNIFVPGIALVIVALLPSRDAATKAFAGSGLLERALPSGENGQRGSTK